MLEKFNIDGFLLVIIPALIFWIGRGVALWIGPQWLKDLLR